MAAKKERDCHCQGSLSFLSYKFCIEILHKKFLSTFLIPWLQYNFVHAEDKKNCEIYKYSNKRSECMSVCVHVKVCVCVCAGFSLYARSKNLKWYHTFSGYI